MTIAIVSINVIRTYFKVTDIMESVSNKDDMSDITMIYAHSQA